MKLDNIWIKVDAGEKTIKPTLSYPDKSVYKNSTVPLEADSVFLSLIL